MSHAVTSTPRPKPPFRILFTQGNSQSTILRKGTPKILRQGNSMTDLDQAVHSITDEVAENHVTPVSTPARKNFTSPNMVTLNSNDSAGKLQKILFLPKYVQKKVTILDQKKPIKKDTIVTLPKPRMNIITDQKVNDFPAPKKRKLGDIALESMHTMKKPIIQVVEPPPEPEPAAPENSDNPICRICGHIIEDEVIPLLDSNSGQPTPLGAKYKAITSDVLGDPLIPTTLCLPCSKKLHVCFCLTIEIQAGHEVMVSASTQNGGDCEIHPHQMFTCPQCEQEVMGTAEFIQHYENHVKERNVGVDEDPALSKAVKSEPQFKFDADVLIAEATALIEDNVEEDGLPSFQNELGEFVCELCGRTFKHLFLLVLHRKAPRRGRKTVTALPVSDEPLTCFVCGQSKTSVNQLYEPCDECKTSVETENSRKIKHCSVCGEGVPEMNIAKHTLTHQGKSFICDTCGRGFLQKSALRKHLSKHCHDIQISFSDFNCVDCDLKFKTPREYRTHMKKVHGEQVTCLSQYLSCPKCPNSYPDMFRLRIHMKVIHRMDIPFRKRIGGRVRQIECHVCGKILNSENSTRVHMKEEHGLANHQMEVLKQACEVCGKIFSVKQNLIYHINSAHLNIKPMPCDVCGERFGKHSSLIFHKLRHTGEKPFQCTVCLKSYRQRNDVIRHLARHVRDKEVEYEAAHAVNTSRSKFVSKRYIFLKDSTIKGLLETTRADAVHRRKTHRIKTIAEETVQVDQQTDHYEEIVLGEGTVLMAEHDENFTEDVVTRYIMADGDGTEYIVQEGDDNVQYVIDDDGNTRILLGEEGEHDGEQVYVINDDEDAVENIRYILENDDNGETENQIVEDDDTGKLVIKSELNDDS